MLTQYFLIDGLPKQLRHGIAVLDLNHNGEDTIVVLQGPSMCLPSNSQYGCHRESMPTLAYRTRVLTPIFHLHLRP